MRYLSIHLLNYVTCILERVTTCFKVALIRECGFDMKVLTLCLDKDVHIKIKGLMGYIFVCDVN